MTRWLRTLSRIECPGKIHAVRRWVPYLGFEDIVSGDTLLVTCDSAISSSHDYISVIGVHPTITFLLTVDSDISM